METHQIKPQNKFRRRKVFSIGITLSTSEIVWTGKWFKYVVVEEEKCLVRYKYFDDGWTYAFYWGEWKETWEFRRLC